MLKKHSETHFSLQKFGYIKKKQYLCTRFRLTCVNWDIYRGVEQW